MGDNEKIYDWLIHIHIRTFVITGLVNHTRLYIIQKIQVKQRKQADIKYEKVKVRDKKWPYYTYKQTCHMDINAILPL